MVSCGGGAGVDLKRSLGFPSPSCPLTVFLGLGGIALPAWFPMVSNGVPSPGGTGPAASEDNALGWAFWVEKGAG